MRSVVRASLLALMALVLAEPATAQEAAIATAPANAPAPPPETDLIGALIQQEQTKSPAPVETLPAVQTPPPVVRLPYVPPPPRTTLTAPVHIDEVGKTPDGPPTPTDLTYESRMRANIASAQGLQGVLDGRWALVAGAMELYDLQVVDSGDGVLEGAWRDPRRRGANDASGFIDSIQKIGTSLDIRLTPRPGADQTVIVLNPIDNGRWSGTLTERGETRDVILRRD